MKTERAYTTFNADVLKLDRRKELEKIVAGIREGVVKQLRKRGVVIALSGGVDSSVVATLCIRALGKDRVLGLLLTEKDFSPETLALSRLIIKHLEIPSEYKDITDILAAVGCYQYRDEAIKKAELFDLDKVARLLKKLQVSDSASEVDNMALVGILSSHLIHHQFVENFPSRAYDSVSPSVIIDRRAEVYNKIN